MAIDMDPPTPPKVGTTLRQLTYEEGVQIARRIRAVQAELAEAKRERANLLTDAERGIVHDLERIGRRIHSLTPVGSRSSDTEAVSFHVQALRRLVLGQAAARAFPDEFPLLGEWPT